MSDVVTSEPSAATPPPSVHERMKAVLSGPPAESQAKTPSESVDDTESRGETVDKPVPATAERQEADQDDSAADVQSDDAQSEDWQPSSVEELAESLGWDSDKLLNLNAKVKIDGKEGTATLRDLFKSYQLDGHINQKLASLDTDRKALMAERQQFQAERADKLLKLDAGMQTLQRSLIGEFQSVDWQKLAAEDPAAYNASLVSFQQRNQTLQDIAAQINQEKQAHQEQLLQEQKAWLDEQRKLMSAKIPEWADEGIRAKDKAEIAKYLDGYGITKEEFEAIGDHRHALVIRDAWQWNKLQKSKPAVLNKVKAAPKLLKPGTQQSKDAVQRLAFNKGRERLRQTGKVADAVAPLRELLFSRG